MSGDRIMDLPDDPPMPERVQLRWPLKNLAVAVLEDAISLLARKPTASLSEAGVKAFLAEQAEARRWLTDCGTLTPFSLTWCCLVIETATGYPFPPHEVAAVVASGRRIEAFRVMVGVGGKGMVVGGAEPKPRKRWAKGGTTARRRLRA